MTDDDDKYWLPDPPAERAKLAPEQRLRVQAELRERRRLERAKLVRLELEDMKAKGIAPPMIDVPEEGGPPASIERARIDLLLPLLPGPPSWRTSVSSFYGRADERIERARADALIALAVEEALADLTANPRAKPPPVVAMQLYDHYIARDERTLPPHALGLLRRAMRIDPRQIVALERRAAIAVQEAAGRSQKTIAVDLGITPREIHRLLNRPVTPRVALYAAIAEGGDLRAHRPAVAAALGLVGEDGRWQPRVLAAVRGGAVEAELMREAACVDAKERLRRDPFVSKAERKLRKAHEAAEAARIDGHDTARADLELARAIQNAQNWRRSARTKQNDEFAIAKAIGRDGAEVDPRKVRRWMELPGWELLVLGEMIRLRNERARS